MDLNPPRYAAVFCVDEKTAIQALDRKDPVLPLSPGRAERHGFEYFRHGTLSLYAAFNTKTGEVRSSMDLPHDVSLDLAIRHVAALPDPVVPAYTAFDARLAWRPRPDVELS